MELTISGMRRGSTSRQDPGGMLKTKLLERLLGICNILVSDTLNFKEKQLKEQHSICLQYVQSTDRQFNRG